jgi:hypothetical protein
MKISQKAFSVKVTRNNLSYITTADLFNGPVNFMSMLLTPEASYFRLDSSILLSVKRSLSLSDRFSLNILAVKSEFS